MNYTVTRLDGRYSYRETFKYYIGFSATMARQQGPVAYNDAILWFTGTYGWSAEIREYMKILRWNQDIKLWNRQPTTGMLDQTSQHCNPHWSWTNAYEDRRIYVAGDEELAFFQLANARAK